MAFEALDELLDETIRLPLPGRDGTHEYVIPSPPAEDGLIVERFVEAMRQAAKDGTRPDMEFLNDDEERDLYRLVLGPAYDEMVAAGVKWAWLKHAAMTAIVWISTGTSAAERYWKAAGGRPEPEAPNRAARRATGTRQGSSQAVKSTRSRGSRSTTSTPRATARKPPEQAD
ncbi:DUF7426 family protein [Streptomyces macrosporus]|uniref:DUF7426 domain-containing protein n=1 Tax=Streptomyces macrosporus TaxID=44032 RepID=A0ABP5XQ59_9ACTN